MNPLDLALKTEQDGADFYLSQALKASDPQTKELFLALAEDEKRHYQALKELRELKNYEYTGRDSLTLAKEIFPRGPITKENLEQKQSLIEVYEMAMGFEKDSIKLYTQLAREAEEPSAQKAFLALADEEESHRLIFWRLIELLRRPEEWYPYLSF